MRNKNIEIRLQSAVFHLCYGVLVPLLCNDRGPNITASILSEGKLNRTHLITSIFSDIALNSSYTVHSKGVKIVRLLSCSHWISFSETRDDWHSNPGYHGYKSGALPLGVPAFPGRARVSWMET